MTNNVTGKAFITTEVFAIPYEQAYIIYAPLRRLAFAANAAAVDTLALLKSSNIPHPTEEQATFLHFLTTIGLTGTTGDAPIRGLNHPAYQPVEVTLFLTAECNLRCVYCYARAGDLPTSRMSIETARRGIDYVVANALERNTGWFGVNYHGGGEPTLNHAVLTASHAYASALAKQHGLRLYTGIATNGVLSPRGRRWIIEHLQGASVSLDGIPTVNDRNRPTVTGHGSGKLVLATLKAFDEANFRYGIRITVSSKTVDEMASTVRFILEQAKPQRVQIEPVYDIGRGEQSDLHVDSSAFIQGYRAAQAIAEEKGVALRFSSARLDTLTSRFCSAYGEGFSLTPSGKVSGCYEVYDESADFAEDVIFGHFDDERKTYYFDLQKLQYLRQHDVTRQTWCNGCFAKWHCSGDCPNKACHATHTGQFQGMPACEITRTLVLDQLTQKINEAGGIIWLGTQPSIAFNDFALNQG